MYLETTSIKRSPTVMAIGTKVKVNDNTEYCITSSGSEGVIAGVHITYDVRFSKLTGVSPDRAERYKRELYQFRLEDLTEI